jgi:hypothetical protein
LTRLENILKNKSRIFDAEYLKNGFFVQALIRLQFGKGVNLHKENGPTAI